MIKNNTFENLVLGQKFIGLKLFRRSISWPKYYWSRSMLEAKGSVGPNWVSAANLWQTTFQREVLWCRFNTYHQNQYQFEWLEPSLPTLFECVRCKYAISFTIFLLKSTKGRRALSRQQCKLSWRQLQTSFLALVQGLAKPIKYLTMEINTCVRPADRAGARARPAHICSVNKWRYMEMCPFFILHNAGSSFVYCGILWHS